MLDALKSVERLVVRCPNWVGDIVMATPVFECLRQNFPDAHISALIRPYARGIIEPNPWFDRIIDCDDKTVAGLRRIRTALRAPRTDAGILLTNTTHSFLTLKLAGVPQVYGYRRNFRRHFLTGPEPIRVAGKISPRPMQDYYLELCRYLDLVLPAGVKPRLYTDEALRSAAATRLAGYGIQAGDRVIGFNPGASFGSSKCWPPEHFARLAERLQEDRGAKILLLVGPGEESIAEKIVAASRAQIINTAADHIGLAELKALVQRCELLITNDTGPRHFAVAFDVPNIVLMGPTNPIYTQSNLELTTVLRRDLECSPCHKKICPLGHHACMTEITPQMVMEAIADRWGGSPIASETYS